MKILICSDGSPQAAQALRMGMAIASACRADTTLLGIIEHSGDSKAVVDSLTRGQAALLSNSVPAEMITKSGKPVPEIIQRTRQTEYDLVVVGAARKQRHNLFWMSSKTYRIIKEIRPPVLSVSGACGPIQRMLICSGGKPYIDRAVQLAGEIARATKAAVTLLHVLPEPPAIYAHLPHMDETATWLLNSPSELGLNLKHTKELLDSMQVPVEFRVRHGPVLAEILREVNGSSYEIVVTGSALSHSLRTYILGDVTREVVNRASCAVLVARTRPDPFTDLLRPLGRLLPHAD